ncbi:hypothetical protein [Pseudomonas sp. 6D_7.1_Bac1]|uniref:hypothetical protein n=1 Tax=Pseudomonas sp. 6D_7.1_Bac1 TaxID=2971615 RepID=UPI0021C813DF|nr:hypothetical protein [Pseudomonas sp. 6D_7.1_Bac1]MCU1752194.1 hypothetical protein [Pseudomonas sp. 6D_7.1_Bac1]
MVQRTSAFDQWSPEEGDKLTEYSHSNGCFSEIRLRRTHGGLSGIMFIGVYREDGRAIAEQIFDISDESDNEATIWGMDEAKRWVNR